MRHYVLLMSFPMRTFNLSKHIFRQIKFVAGCILYILIFQKYEILMVWEMINIPKIKCGKRVKREGLKGGKGI